MMILQKIFFALLITVGCVVFGITQSIEPNSKIPGKLNITYLNLVRKIFPDAQIDEKDLVYLKATAKIPLRNLFGEPPAKIYASEMQGELKIGINEKLQTVNGNKKFLCLIISAFEKSDGVPSNGGNRILAAFRVVENGVRLIDAAAIKTDDFTTFGNTKVHPKIIIAPHHEAVVVYNSTMLVIGKETYSIVDVNEKGFNVLLNQFDVNRDIRCGEFIQERVRLKLLQPKIAGYRNIEFIVTTEKGVGDEDLIVRWRRHYRYVFDWRTRTQNYKAVINPDNQRRAVLKKYNPCYDNSE